MIVMEAYGRSGSDRFLSESTVDGAIRTVPCPVLTIHK
ncbi:MAG: universal stress protein [Candidatus Hydrothermarchaeales archaeon]